MPRHLTLADIGRGASRRRAPRNRWTAPLATGAAVTALLTAAVVLVPHAAPPPVGTRAPAAGAASAPDPFCRTGTTRLTVTASPDLAPLLSRVAGDWSPATRDAAGRCVQVVVVPREPGDVLQQLVTGAPDGPDVWVPPSSLWLSLLRDRLAAASRPPLLPTPPTSDDAPAVATSPLVVAMPRPMALALGWPGRPIGWADLARLADARTGWGAVGRPEWGAFRLGRTDPLRSPTGLAAAVAEFQATVPQGAALTADDVTADGSRRFVADVERSVVRYGTTTTSLLADWSRADAAGQGLTFLSALVTDEQLVAAYNDGNPTGDPARVGRDAKPRVPLVAVYPQEGTPVADHPYAVLEGREEGTRSVAQAFLAHLRAPAVQRVLQAGGFRGADGAPGAQAGPAIGVLPMQPTRSLPQPAPNVVDAVLDGWEQVRLLATRPRAG